MIKNRLSRKISRGIVLMAFAVLALSIGILYMKSRNLIHQEVTECAASTLRTAQLRVRNFMISVEKSTDANIWYVEENFQPDSLLDISRRIVMKNPNVNGCSISAEPGIFPQHGRYFSVYTLNNGDTIVSVVEPDYEYFDKVWYSTPVQTGRACWIDPFCEYTAGTLNPNQTIATYCKPLHLEDGRLAGVISTNLSFKQLAETINDFKCPYDGAYFVLLGGDGRFLVHPDSTQVWRKTIFTDADLTQDKDLIALGHEMTAGRQGTMHVNTNGEEYHVCYKPVEGTGWSLAFVVPDHEAMKGYYRLGYVIAALLVIGLIVILLLSHKVVKRFVSPVDKLIDATQKITDGQYDATVPAISGEVIIDQLQDGFAQMQQSLSEHMGSLRKDVDETRQRNKELEQTMQQAEDVINKRTHFIENAVVQMRAPLNFLTGFADVLAQIGTGNGMVSEEELTEAKRIMKHDMAGMSRIMIMLYDATDTDAHDKLLCQRVDKIPCNEICRECIDHTQSHYPEIQIKFETELHESMLMLTNKVYLTNILREILHNAAMFSDGKHILLRATRTDSSVCFTVQDVGQGMSGDICDLDPTTKTDNLSEATGLGLPLSKRHVAAMDGKIIIDKDYRDGCRITVELSLVNCISPE